MPRAPCSESNFFLIFVDLLSYLVEAKEQEVDIRRAKAGLPPRATCIGRGQPSFSFNSGLDNNNNNNYYY